ncbi:MAG: 3-methyl-2-oxobutanoate hydroxymethyltransferase [Acidimicrobiales bacterium]
MTTDGLGLTVPAVRAHKRGPGRAAVTGPLAGEPEPLAHGANGNGSGAGPAGGGRRPLVMVTAYDAPGAAMADRAGVDIILVGDSVAMAVLGYEDTLQLTVADMAHHVAAVRRARPRCLVVADLPWMSYHLSPAETVANAAVLVRAGAQAVKLEGGRSRVPMVEALLRAEVQVMGHLGLTPQSVHGMGGYRVQARQVAEADAMVADAMALAGAGCFALVLEGVPDVVAEVVTGAVAVPTIGIGAGPGCDGQVLVLHDVLGLSGVGAGPGYSDPRFVRRYADLGRDGVAALAAWAADVREGRFPSSAESYHAGAALDGWTSRPRSPVPG